MAESSAWTTCSDFRWIFLCFLSSVFATRWSFFSVWAIHVCGQLVEFVVLELSKFVSEKKNTNDFLVTEKQVVDKYFSLGNE